MVTDTEIQDFKHSGTKDRLSRSNPGPLATCGTVRGTLITMLDRYELDEVRDFWRNLPIVVNEKKYNEADGYRYLWEEQGWVHVHYLEEVNIHLMDFLYKKGENHYQFFNEKHYRFNQGGLWSAKENLSSVKSHLADLYTKPDPKFTLLELASKWGNMAVPGSVSELQFLRLDEREVSAIFSFAPDGTFGFRCPFLFSRSTMLGMQMLPKLLKFTPFEETTLLADCLHPDEILRNAELTVADGEFHINGIRHGIVVPFSAWSRSIGFKYNGNPIPERDVILMESDFHCEVRGIPVLSKGCIYDAPIFLARVGYPRLPKTDGGERKQEILDNILNGLSLGNSSDWMELERKFKELIQRAEEKVVIEYRRSSQLMLMNGNALISGVSAMILRKILMGWVKKQSRFDFRAFKHDPEIFHDSKRSSFETRWNRLRAKLLKSSPQLLLEKAGKGEFTFNVKCPIEFHDLG